MTSRPILFSAPMVRALLAGTKTQTRRTDPLLDLIALGQEPPQLRWFGKRYGFLGQLPDKEMVMTPCRFGGPGDELWVRETWRPFVRVGQFESGILYRAGGELADERGGKAWRMETATKWRPSIFMPRWASRLTLEIVAVRVERLNSISDAEAKAEGVGSHNMGTYTPASLLPMPKEWHAAPEHEKWTEKWHAEGCAEMRALSIKRNFINVWESINGPGSWALNSFVWVIEFRRKET